jgi:hypothetical protein
VFSYVRYLVFQKEIFSFYMAMDGLNYWCVWRLGLVVCNWTSEVKLQNCPDSLQSSQIWYSSKHVQFCQRYVNSFECIWVNSPVNTRGSQRTKLKLNLIFSEISLWLNNFSLVKKLVFWHVYEIVSINFKS